MSVDRYFARLPSWSLYQRLSLTQREQFCRLGARVDFRPGDHLLREGETGEEIYLVLQGWTKVTALGEERREAFLAVRGAGDFVGELGAMDRRARIATVRAAGLCVTFCLKGVDLHRFLTEHPAVASLLQGVVNDKLRSATQWRVVLGAARAEVRVARMLESLARSHGRAIPLGVEIPFPLTQIEVGALCGITKASVERALKHLSDEGLIATGYRTISVRDLERLSRFGRDGDD